MTTGRRTASRHTGVIEARGTGKRRSGMARAAIRIGYDMRWCLTSGAEDGAAVAGRT